MQDSMSVHKCNLASMTAVWLLPVVSTIVASATGGIVAEVLPNPDHSLWTLIASYILWGTGIPLAMTILVIYFARLTVHHLPPREVIVSVFLPLGPLGQGGFAIMQLGKVSMQLFPRTGTLLGVSSGETLYNVGFLMAIIMWGYGIVWLFFAVASISHSKFPFNMGWWGFTFPLGVFAIATDTFGKELPSTFFSVLGTVRCPNVFKLKHILIWNTKIISLTVVILWFVVAAGTLKKAITGEIFFAPCLGDLKKDTPTELQVAA
jgi:tellurite resistance protein TehA-like permease